MSIFNLDIEDEGARMDRSLCNIIDEMNQVKAFHSTFAIYVKSCFIVSLFLSCHGKHKYPPADPSFFQSNPMFFA